MEAGGGGMRQAGSLTPFDPSQRCDHPQDTWRIVGGSDERRLLHVACGVCGAGLWFELTPCPPPWRET